MVVIRPDGLEAPLVDAVVFATTPAPDRVDPDVGSTLGGTRHAVEGAGFFSGARVFFGDAEATVTAVAGDRLDVILPANTAGVVDVRVEQGVEQATLVGGFRYVDGTPPW